MRAAWRIALVVIALAASGAASADRLAAQVVSELKINSEQYIVIDAETGEVFAQRGANQRNAMASLTKVFTAIQAIEEAPPDLEITIDESDMPMAEASFMGFSPGEVYRLEELLYGLMLPSGNDAAHAIARALGTENEDDTPDEAVSRFVERINQRVLDMGLTDTHLENPDGWGVPGHYTTVRDLAAFMRYALRYPRFVDLISASSYTLHDGREIYNNNRLMASYADLLGGKTGYDNDSGWCLIEVGQRGGERMISVTFDGIWPDDWYDDNRVLLDYAFDQKAERLAAAGGVTGVVVSFLDPDAAVIQRMATSAGSLGGANPVDPAAGGSSGTDESTDGNALAAGLISVGESDAGSGAAAIAAVLGLILAARAIGAFSYPAPRRVGVIEPGPQRPPRARHRHRRRPAHAQPD